MKRFLLLLLPLLFLSGCSWIGNNQADVEKISQLEQQLSGLMAQVS
jgi:outer membrane lipoprotein-sorting protein